MIIAGLVLAIWNAASAFYALAGLAKFEDLKPDQIGSQLVEADLNIVWDCYLEQGTKNTSTNRTTINYYWYIIATGDEYATDYRYMAIKVPKKIGSKVDDIMDYYYEYGLPASEPLKIAGKIKSSPVNTTIISMITLWMTTTLPNLIFRTIPFLIT